MQRIVMVLEAAVVQLSRRSADSTPAKASLGLPRVRLPAHLMHNATLQQEHFVASRLGNASQVSSQVRPARVPGNAAAAFVLTAFVVEQPARVTATLVIRHIPVG